MSQKGTDSKGPEYKIQLLARVTMLTLLGLYLLSVNQLIIIPRTELLDPGNKAAYFLASTLRSFGS